MSLANENRPNTFASFIGQGKDKGGVVDYFTTVISLNKHPSAVLITGPSGSGKSSLSRLYCKATLCKNREVGDYEACGNCDICLDKDTTNFNEYTVSQATDFKDSIEEIKEIITSMPVGVPDRPDQYRRFLILDEIQLASKQALSSFLNTLEFAPATTTVILVSMDFEKLDPVVKEAIESRCIEHTLSRFTEEEVADNLRKGNTVLPNDAALAIAKFAGGNMRRAWQILQSFDNFSTEDLTENIVYQRKAGGANPESRSLMWQALSSGDFETVRNTFRTWTSNTTEETIADLLIDDVINNSSFSVEITSFLSAISGWLKTIHRPPLVSLVLMFLSIPMRIQETPSIKSDVDTEDVREDEQIKEIFSLPLMDSPSSDIESLVKSSILKTKKNFVPILFSLKKFGDIYQHYKV